MSVIAKYKFDHNVYTDLIPEFNSEFTEYIVSDEVAEDYTIRTIESDDLPTLMRFGSKAEHYVEGQEVALLEVLEINTSALTTCNSMFRYCTKITSIECDWDTNNVTDMYTMFSNCQALTSLDVNNFDTSKVTNMRSMFNNCTSLTSLDVNNFDTSNVTTMVTMFNECNKLTSLDVSNFNTSKVTSINNMFCNCHKLTSLDVSNWDTSNVTDMNGTFFGCQSLSVLNISNFNTSKVTRLSYMFSYCSGLTNLDLSNFNTSNVTTMNQMFRNCNSLTSLDLSNWDTSKVTTTYQMFHTCTSLTTLDMSNWDTSNLTNTSNMFTNCYNLTLLDLNKWDTSNVTNMRAMFNNCKLLTTLDISNFNTSNVTDMTYMFYNCKTLTDVGMIYCNEDTINQTSALTYEHNTIIWVGEDINISSLDQYDHITYKKYDVNIAGKYLVEILVNDADENTIDTKLIYLNSPLLEGDKILTSNGKTYHWHKRGMRTYEEGDEDIYITDLVNTVYELDTPYYEEVGVNEPISFEPINIITNTSIEPTIEIVGNYKLCSNDKIIINDVEIPLKSPLLEGDSIELIDDKYYHYHVRDMELITENDEMWYDKTLDNTIVFYINKNHWKEVVNMNVFCDKFPIDENNTDVEKVVYDGWGLYVYIYKYRLSSLNVTGFKQWLSENPVTVVYELEEPYYEEIEIPKFIKHYGGTLQIYSGEVQLDSLNIKF